MENLSDEEHVKLIGEAQDVIERLEKMKGGSPEPMALFYAAVINAQQLGYGWDDMVKWTIRVGEDYRAVPPGDVNDRRKRNA